MDEDVLLFLAVVFAVFFHNIFSDKSNSESRKAKKSKDVKSPPQKNKQAKPTKRIKIIDKVRFPHSDQPPPQKNEQAKPTKRIKIIDKVRFPHSDQPLWEAKRNDDGYKPVIPRKVVSKPVIPPKETIADLNEKVLILNEYVSRSEDLTFYYQDIDENSNEFKVAPLNIFFKYDNNESKNQNKIWYLDAFDHNSKKNFKFLINKITLPNKNSGDTLKRNEKRQKFNNYFSKNKKKLKKDFCLMCEKNLIAHDLSFFKIFNDKNKESALPYETDGLCWSCFSYTYDVNLPVCINCEGPIPEKRSLAGYNECVPCVEEREEVDGYTRKVPDIK